MCGLSPYLSCIPLVSLPLSLLGILGTRDLGSPGCGTFGREDFQITSCLPTLISAGGLLGRFRLSLPTSLSLLVLSCLYLFFILSLYLSCWDRVSLTGLCAKGCLGRRIWCSHLLVEVNPQISQTVWGLDFELHKLADLELRQFFRVP